MFTISSATKPKAFVSSVTADDNTDIYDHTAKSNSVWQIAVLLHHGSHTQHNRWTEEWRREQQKDSKVTALFSIGHQQILRNKSDVKLHEVD